MKKKDKSALEEFMEEQNRPRTDKERIEGLTNLNKELSRRLGVIQSYAVCNLLGRDGRMGGKSVNADAVGEFLRDACFGNDLKRKKKNKAMDEFLKKVDKKKLAEHLGVIPKEY